MYEVGDATCSYPNCGSYYKSHHWGNKEAQREGWFLQKNGDKWCPNHIPEWVDQWREKNGYKPMKKQVLESTCDTCGKVVVNDFKPIKDRAEYDLPEKWIHLRADTRTKTIMARDLCDECAKPILGLIKDNNK